MLADETTSTETSATETVTAIEPVADTTALGAASVETKAPADPTAETEVKASEETGEGEEAAAVVPEKYELAGTDGGELDAVALEAAAPVFKELGLSNDQAQKLIPVAEQFAKSIGDRLNQQILDSVATERKAWLDTAKADEEIGGSKWDSSIVTAAKALDGLGLTKGSAFRNLLDESGLGNHPEMIRAFVKVGNAISEDSNFPRAGGSSQAPRTTAEILYPKTGA